MNKKITPLLLALCLVLQMAIVGFSRPSIGGGWLIVSFFALFFGVIFFGLQSAGLFLNFNSNKVTRVSFIVACIGTAAQVLVTFQALRPIELILISSVLGLTGWYISRAKT